MVIKEKAKVLEQLMNEEKPTLKANTNKRVFDITKEFCKKLDKRRISQAFDSTRGIVDFSSSKLFNTTLQSARPGLLNRTQDIKSEKYQKKYWTESVVESVSHRESQL